MTWRRSYQRQTGYVPIVAPGPADGTKIGFGLLYLAENETYTGNTGEREVALVILSGTCAIAGEGFNFPAIGERQTVFAGKPYAVYLPRQTAYQVTAQAWAEIALCTAPATRPGEVKLVTPADVVYKQLGYAHWKREAHFIIDNRIKAENLFLGETILAPGQWAFPPHCHDVADLPDESFMEELYFFRTRPATGFGVQLIYTEDDSIDEAYMVKNDDTVIFPRGFHPAVASPGNAMYILWVMAGPRRLFLSRPDPRFRWMENCHMNQ